MNIFKSLTNAFTKTKSFFGGGMSVISWAIPGSWGKRQQLQRFNRYVHSIVSAYAQDFAKVDLVMQRKVGKQWQDQESHELIDVLDHPNSIHSGFQFRELHAVYMNLAGESFWYKVKSGKKVKEFYLIRPDLMEVEVAKDKVGSIKAYKMTKDDGSKTTFEPDEIIHHKLPNPMNPYRGLGIVEAAMVYLQTEEFSSDWTKNSIYNSGRPSGIINLRGNMDDSQFDQLKKRFRQEYSGTKNAGKTLLIKGFDGIDFQKLGIDLDGVELKNIKDITRDDIMFMFRVSKTIMGITDDVNRANAKEARAVWMENNIKPGVERLIDQVNYSEVVPNYGNKFRLYYIDPNPETIEDKLDEWEKGHNKWLTTNDIRKERGLDPVPGGDVIYQPLNLLPMEKEQAPKDDTGKGVKKKVTRQKRAEIFWKNLFSGQEAWEKPYQKAVNKVFKQQQAEILQQTKKGLSEWLFDRVESSLVWQRVLYPLTVELMVDQAKQTFDFEDVQGELEITPDLQRRINDRIDRFSSEVDKETQSFIEATIAEGISAGESVAKLRKRITDIYDTATTMRSERIARTETIFASNEAGVEAMRQIPTVTGHEWFTNPGACEFCQSLNGKIVGLDTPFVYQGQTVDGDDGGQYVANYETVDHPPLHPNCRCTTIPVNIQQFRAYNAMG
jgi:HK97 family phage portal protein